MEPMAWEAEKKHGKCPHSGGCAGGSRVNAGAKAERLAKIRKVNFVTTLALTPRPGTRMRTLPEMLGRLASR